MKIVGLKPANYRRALRGALVIRQGRGGQLSAQAWPKKAPKTLTADQVAARAEFVLATQLIKTLPAPEIQSAYEIAQGTPFLPRDISMMCAYGTLWEIVGKDGTVIKGVRMAAQEINALLSTISMTIGDTVMYTSGGWSAFSPGTAGWVLTSNGPGSPPSYQPAQGGSGGAGACSLVTTQDATGLTEVSWTDLDSTTADYRLVWRDLVCAQNSGILVGTGSGPTWITTGYQFATYRTFTNGYNDRASSTNFARLPIIEPSSTPGERGHYDIADYVCTFNVSAFTSNLGFGMMVGGAMIPGSTPWTAIKLFNASGTFGSGSVSLYKITR